MAGYNGAWTGQQIDEAIRQVTNKDLPADGVKFADGQTFQQKYDAGQLTGPAGQDGKDGAQGEPGTPGRDGATGPAGRGITGVSYSSSTNLWTISYSDGSSDKITGPAIPTQLSQLIGDASHRTVTDTEKSTWNGKSNFSGSYTDLTNKPAIPTVSTSVTSTSTKTAASSSAVKQAYDKAVSALNQIGVINSTLDDINGEVV